MSCSTAQSQVDVQELDFSLEEVGKFVTFVEGCGQCWIVALLKEIGWLNLF